MIRKIMIAALATLLLASVIVSLHALPVSRGAHGAAAPTPDAPWTFAVSGDSRNCGDVVVPAIAQQAKELEVQFYWHLGDLRAIYKMDEDLVNAEEHEGKTLKKGEYWSMAWKDFTHYQLDAFAPLPVYLGIGNHEVISPKSRGAFVNEFSKLPNAPWVSNPNEKYDFSDPTALTRYHWRRGAVEFIYLDNATKDQFDDKQVAWFEKILADDDADNAVHTVVVGMHEALPDSLAAGHSMNISRQETESGRRVYLDLLQWREKTKKRVYVLASHSHFFMEDIFNSSQWQAYREEFGPVLPGWIVGTAGAVRYALPPDAKYAKQAITNVYGFLLGRVNEDGEIQFDFQPIAEKDVPPATASRFSPAFVNWCFAENSEAR
ncbi:MAG: hypothetical protein ACRD50_10290 [Candidatus Acidiferrales bacterium]